MATNKPQSTFRVGGGYTAFKYNGQVLAYCQMIRETAPQPVAQATPIQPLNEQYPIEIALPAALQAGTIELTFYEQWITEVWAELALGDTTNPFYTASDLLGVYRAQLSTGPVSCQKVITIPGGGQRLINYAGCIVQNVTIDEMIQIGTMTIPKSITLMYTQRTEVLPQ